MVMVQQVSGFIIILLVCLILFSQKVVMDVVNVLNSLLQWEPENIMVTSSSRLVNILATGM